MAELTLPTLFPEHRIFLLDRRMDPESMEEIVGGINRDYLSKQWMILSIIQHHDMMIIWIGKVGLGDFGLDSPVSGDDETGPITH